MSRRRSAYRSRRRKRGFFFFHFSFRVLLIICASALVAGYLSPFINPETFVLPTLFGLYFIPIAVLNLILLIVALIRRSGSFWIPFMTLLPTIFISEFIYQPPKEAVPWEKDEIKILTYNVGLFTSGKDGMDEDDTREAVMNFIKENKPDIVCLQECRIRDTLSIKRLFKDYRYTCHHFVNHSDGHLTGNLTASRYPITATGNMIFEGSTNMSLWCDITYNDCQYRVFNNHLQSNSISLTALLKKIGRRDSDLRPELEKIHEKLMVSVSKRSHQTTEILANINRCRKPSIVCGDFNDIPLSYTFHNLCKGRKDSFAEAGSGFGATYSVLWPMLRIDYILLPENTAVLSHTTPRNTYSDHYPVITRFRTDDEKKQ